MKGLGLCLAGRAVETHHDVLVERKRKKGKCTNDDMSKESKKGMSQI
jgi:hypothetical protein